MAVWIRRKMSALTDALSGRNVSQNKPRLTLINIGGLQPFPRDSNNKDPGGHVG